MSVPTLPRYAAPMRTTLLLLIALSASGCRGARIRHLERDVEQMSSRVTALESRVAELERRTTVRMVPAKEDDGPR